MICFPIFGCLTASAKQGTGLVRATWSRKDGMAPDCKGALCKRGGTDKSRGKRVLNEKENWRCVELRRRKWEREKANQLIRLGSGRRDTRRAVGLTQITESKPVFTRPLPRNP